MQSDDQCGRFRLNEHQLSILKIILPHNNEELMAHQEFSKIERIPTYWHKKFWDGHNIIQANHMARSSKMNHIRFFPLLCMNLQRNTTKSPYLWCVPGRLAPGRSGNENCWASKFRFHSLIVRMWEILIHAFLLKT